MKTNVDLTDNRSFSNRRRLEFISNTLTDMNLRVNEYIQIMSGRISKFANALRIIHWQAFHITKNKFLSSLGINRFHKDSDNYDLDYLIESDCHCMCCGRIKPPWRDSLCKRCENNHKINDIPMTSDDYNRYYNSWPRVRNQMKSDKSILYR